LTPGSANADAVSASPNGHGTPTADAPCGVDRRQDAPAKYQHVIWILMENKKINQIVGSPNAPYLNKLAGQCGMATNYFAITNPSAPNYIAMTSGTTHGVKDDANPSAHRLSGPSIFSQLGSHWQALQESMPRNCARTASGLYAPKHNPAAYYTNIARACSKQDVKLTSRPDLSARFTFITPNLCHDSHSCSVSTGDRYLAGLVAKIVKSPEYRGGRTALFITYDEDDGGTANHIPTLVISPHTRAGTRSAGRFNHFSMLRTTEDMLGLGHIGGARKAPSMRRAFGL